MATQTNNRFIKVDGAFIRQQPGETLPSPQQYMQQNDPGSLSNFQNANPGLDFNQQDMQQYQQPGSAPTARNNPFETGDYSSISSPHDAFNLLAFDLLKRAQGVDNTELLKRRRELQRAVLSEESAMTPENLRTLSPDQQEAMRRGNIDALRPEIDQNAADIANADTTRQNFERVYLEAQKFGKDFAEKMVAPESVINSYKTAIESSPELISTILSGVNDKTREKVFQSLDYSKLKKAGPAVKRDTSVQEVGGRKVLIDNQTGEAIKDLGVATPAGGGADKIAEQNALDAQTINSHFQQIEAIAAKVGKTPETLNEKDIANLSNTDYDTVSKSLARLQGFDVARAGGDAGSALGATSLLGKAKQGIRAGIGGQKYLPSEVLGGIQTAIAIKNQRNVGNPSNTDTYAKYRIQLEPGEILVKRGNQILALLPNELMPTDKQL